MHKNILQVLVCCFFTVFGAAAQAPTMHFAFDEETGTDRAVEAVSGATFPIRHNFNKPERTAGIAGNALRLDGFSTWVEASVVHDYKKHFTLESWVILESYPADAEVPYARLSPSAFISQADGSKGFQLGINTFGQWFFQVNMGGVNYTCPATGGFPLYAWVHVAAVADGAKGQLRLYLNGVEAGAMSFPANSEMLEAAVPLLIGKSQADKYDGIFLLNALNGALDDTRLYDQALSPADIQAHYQAGAGQARALGAGALQVPASRFARDNQRPAYHALPPANWANEPHGLVKHNGLYHMFYQRTPNGPFKTQMHWGHLVSPDLVTWTNTRDALWPSLEWSATAGYDMKGIWSGDVIMHRNTAYAFYTNVNHSGSYNPGIALATSTDANLETWQKHGPVIGKENVNDFRDPYIWREGDTWHMLIGAALNGGGGLAYYTSADLLNWTFKPGFTAIPYSQMDINSVIWEMPVFEALGQGKHILVVNPIGGSIGKYGPTKFTRAVYWIGTWRNGQFTPDYAQPKMLDLIHGHLSPTVERDYQDNLVGIGIVDERRSSQAQLAAGWAHLFSLPRVWHLLPDGKTLGQKPLPALEKIRQAGTHKKLPARQVTGPTALPALTGKSLEVVAYVDTTATGTHYGLNLRVSPGREERTLLYYDTQQQKIFLDKTRSSLAGEAEEQVLLSGHYDVKAFGKPYKFQVFLDHSVIDVFINDAAAFSSRIYPSLASSEGLELFSGGGATTFSSVESWVLDPAAATPAPGAAVTGVALGQTAFTLPAGQQTTIFAAVQPAQAGNKAVTWTADNTAVATVDTAGVVTALAPGTTTIRATTRDGGFTDQATVTVLAAGPTPYLRYDFEQGDFSNLTVTGEAFQVADIVTENSWGWGGPFHHQGQKHLWGFKQGGDGQAGELRTPDFVLGGNGKITFLLGGGKNLNTLYVALVRAADQVVLMKATGLNDEAYAPKVFDAAAYVGTICYVQVVDREGGGYGHLNLDNLVIPVLSTQVTGIKKNKPAALPPIKAFPVPAGDSFNLDLRELKKERARVELFDLQGRKVQAFEVRAGNLVTIPVKGLQSRQVLLVKTTTATGFFTQKIITR